jgi:predicted O-methyltransferase YrrM
MPVSRDVPSVIFSRDGLDTAIKHQRKYWRRMRDPKRRRATAWCRKHSTDIGAFAQSVDAALWEEATEAQKRIVRLRRERLVALDLPGARASDIGGGPGNLALLHWLVRLLKSKTVLETGVASGASSRAILEALHLNGSGHLYSSDLSGVIPREHSGLCVDAEMTGRWTLLHDGDRKNIPRFVESVASIDLVHYDSAKNAEEMHWVLEQLAPLLAPRAVIVLDDVDRHGFMHNFVRNADRSWVVFRTTAVLGLTEALESRSR